MKRQWRTRRTTTPHVNGQQRWDQAYQSLLRWTCPTPPDLTGLVPTPTQEVSHASSNLCTGVDLTPSPGSDY
jgi:hypothetical protein